MCACQITLVINRLVEDKFQVGPGNGAGRAWCWGADVGVRACPCVCTSRNWTAFLVRPVAALFSRSLEEGSGKSIHIARAARTSKGRFLMFPRCAPAVCRTSSGNLQRKTATSFSRPRMSLHCSTQRFTPSTRGWAVCRAHIARVRACLNALPSCIVRAHDRLCRDL